MPDDDPTGSPLVHLMEARIDVLEAALENVQSGASSTGMETRRRIELNAGDNTLFTDQPLAMAVANNDHSIRGFAPLAVGELIFVNGGTRIGGSGAGTVVLDGAAAANYCDLYAARFADEDGSIIASGSRVAGLFFERDAVMDFPASGGSNWTKVVFDSFGADTADLHKQDASTMVVVRAGLYVLEATIDWTA